MKVIESINNKIINPYECDMNTLSALMDRQSTQNRSLVIMSLILIVESVGFGVRAESVVDGFDPERPSQQATAVDGVDAQRTSSVKLATSGWDSLRSASQSASRTATSKSVVDGVDVDRQSTEVSKRIQSRSTPVPTIVDGTDPERSGDHQAASIQISRLGTQLVVKFPAGYSLQTASSMTDTWRTLSNDPSGTFTVDLNQANSTAVGFFRAIK